MLGDALGVALGIPRSRCGRLLLLLLGFDEDRERNRPLEALRELALERLRWLLGVRVDLDLDLEGWWLERLRLRDDAGYADEP